MVAALLPLNIGCSIVEAKKNSNESGQGDPNSITQLVIQDLHSDEIAKRINALSSTFSSAAASGIKISEAYDKGNNEQKVELLLDLAKEMSLAQSYNRVTDKVLLKSGEAVKKYPHPLLLNNYASLLLGAGYAQDALFFYKEAEGQQPGNPMLLTNIANACLELDDFSAAEQYAKKALQVSNDYGPAYQVLTTIHLKNGNSELAAETMVKSARHCFNDITIYHFESFLSAVSELDPLEDEYPLKEEYIEELYKIATSNVDTRAADVSSDTPGSQLSLKSFPQFGDLVEAYPILEEETTLLQGKLGKVNAEYDKFYNAINEHFEDGPKPSKSVFPVIDNIRQIYTYNILNSYYDFRIRQIEERYREKLDDLQLEEEESLQKISDKYYEKKEQAEQDSDEAAGKILVELLTSLNGNQMPHISQYNNKLLLGAVLDVECSKETYDTGNKYARGKIQLLQNQYNETKQLLEEYWLRIGGLIKYITDENVYQQICLERERYVYDIIGRPISELESMSNLLKYKKEDISAKERELAILQNSVGMGMEALNQLEKQADEEKKKREEAEKAAKEGVGRFIPDIEKEAITIYPETTDMGAFGFEVSSETLGFNASIATDGDAINVNAGGGASLGPANVSGDVEGNLTDESITVNTAIGVQAEASVDKLAGGELKKALGNISIKASSGAKLGGYMQISGGEVKDRGILYVRETGGSVGLFSRTEKVVVKKSIMTGVAIKTKTVKYKFLFGTFEHRAD